MSDKKQSSIEWLVEQLNGVDTGVSYHYFNSIIEQAKAMYREEIENAYDSVIFDDNGGLLGAKEYYNETFNK